MSTPYESAQLILKLFEMRRETLLREARTWFLRSFHPESIEDIRAVLASQDAIKQPGPAPSFPCVSGAR